MAEKIAVLGAGSWGIAISNLLKSNGHDVVLWEFNPADYKTLLAHRMHDKKLPGIRIADNIRISNHLPEVVEESRYLVLAVPVQTMRQVCVALNDIITGDKVFVNLAKGIEIGSLLRVSQIIRSVIEAAEENNIAVLSGPSHAEEVARQLPTSVVVASINQQLASEIQNIFSNKYFRVYRSADMVGVEIGGALKNVIAIASGITQGLGFGDNTTGALITRGLAEITRMGVRLGADPLTFSGLSGIGDLVTTCISRHSRNRYVGDRIGKGEKLREILSGMAMVAEGVDTCRSARALAEKHDVEMPITGEVYKVLFEDKPPIKALGDLMTRSLKEEVWN